MADDREEPTGAEEALDAAIERDLNSMSGVPGREAGHRERIAADHKRINLVDERRDLESMLTLDPSTVDPNKRYKFVREDRLRVARHKMRGYKFTHLEEGGVRPLVDFDNAGDGLIRVGDMILMEIDRTVAERRQKANEDLATARLGDPRKKLKDKAAERGVRIIEDKS